ncbi:YhhN-like protein-domain-containing protein [Peziza echinospora]|nr:YhhN-like protein-domain-containing protein [Peziza echinospora]
MSATTAASPAAIAIAIADTISLPPQPYPATFILSLTLLIISEANGIYIGSVLFKTLASLSFFLGGYSAFNSLTSASPNLAAIAGVQSQDGGDYVYMLALVYGLGFSVAGDILLIPSRAGYFLSRGTPRVAIKQAKANEIKKAEGGEVQGENSMEQSGGPGIRFKLGMLFFALAHISYIVSFLSLPKARGIGAATTTSMSINYTTFFTVLSLGLGLSHSLNLLSLAPKNTASSFWPQGMHTRISLDMVPLVRIYTVVIIVMVATAASTGADRAGWWQRTVSAVMFAVSDVFVAVDTFGIKTGGWKARAVGWLAYFGAQLGLAGCVVLG